MKPNWPTLVAAVLVCQVLRAAPVCNNGFDVGVNTIPEAAAELSVTFSCPTYGFPVSPNVAVFFEASTNLVSDVVFLTNVNGTATVNFVSDVEGGPVLDPPGPPFTTVREPDSFVAIAVSTTGGVSPLRFTFASDVDESLDRSDTVTIAAVPEPGTALLVALALIVLSPATNCAPRWAHRPEAVDRAGTTPE
jgi:hypothetical protein